MAKERREIFIGFMSVDDRFKKEEELRAPHLAALDRLDVNDVRRVEREDPCAVFRRRMKAAA